MIQFTITYLIRKEVNPQKCLYNLNDYPKTPNVKSIMKYQKDFLNIDLIMVDEKIMLHDFVEHCFDFNICKIYYGYLQEKNKKIENNICICARLNSKLNNLKW